MYAAHYADGRSAAVRPVLVHVLGDNLRIMDAQGALLAVWPASEAEPLVPLPRDFRREPLVLRLSSKGGNPVFERLTFVEPEAARGVLAALDPWLKRRTRHGRRRWLAAGALIWVCVAAVWVGVPLLARQLAPLIPQQWEMSLGEQTRRQMGMLLTGKSGDRMWVTLDARGQGVLDALVERLESVDVAGLHSARDGAPPLRVFVLDSGVVNAFAVPGSSIIVTTGLLKEIEGLDELAAVLAHERAHVRLRHTTQQLLRNVAFQYLMDVLGGGSQLGSTAAQYAVSVGWSRDMEREADEKGLETLRQAHISPAGFARFFRRLEKEDGGDGNKLLALLSSHPGSRERAARMEGMPLYPVKPLYGEDFWKSTMLRGVKERSTPAVRRADRPDTLKPRPADAARHPPPVKAANRAANASIPPIGLPRSLKKPSTGRFLPEQLFRSDASGQQGVEFPAHPRIGGGVPDLLEGKLVFFPVRALDAFTDAKSQQIGGQASQALGFDAFGLGHDGQIRRAARREGMQAGQSQHIVPNGYPGLDDVRRGQKGGQTFVERQPVQLEEIDPFFPGQLDQSGRAHFAFGEGGAGFGVEAQHVFLPQLFQGQGEIAFLADEPNVPLIGPDGQGVDFVLAQTG